jgi:hypothetical protein
MTSRIESHQLGPCDRRLDSGTDNLLEGRPQRNNKKEMAEHTYISARRYKLIDPLFAGALKLIK